MDSFPVNLNRFYTIHLGGLDPEPLPADDRPPKDEAVRPHPGHPIAARTHHPGEGPITSWRAVAAVLAVSLDTIARRRKDAQDVTRPWFATPAEVVEWWRRVLRGPIPTTKNKGGRPRKTTN